MRTRISATIGKCSEYDQGITLKDLRSLRMSGVYSSRSITLYPDPDSLMNVISPEVSPGKRPFPISSALFERQSSRMRPLSLQTESLLALSTGDSQPGFSLPVLPLKSPIYTVRARCAVMVYCEAQNSTQFCLYVALGGMYANTKRKGVTNFTPRIVKLTESLSKVSTSTLLERADFQPTINPPEGRPGPSALVAGICSVEYPLDSFPCHLLTLQVSLHQKITGLYFITESKN